MAKDHPTGKSGLYSALLELKTPEECYRFLQDVCSYAELSAMEQRYNIAEKLMNKQSYTSIMGNIGASSAIISRVSRVLSRDDSVLRRLLEESTAPRRQDRGLGGSDYEQSSCIFCRWHRRVRGTPCHRPAPPRESRSDRCVRHGPQRAGEQP